MLDISQLKIVSEPSEFDFDFIYSELKITYWANLRTKEQVIQSFNNSYAKMVFYGQRPVGFARLITDWVTFAYLADVVVTEYFRGNGIAQLLLTDMLHDSKVAEIKKILLKTKDAAKLYHKYGFTASHDPERFMEKSN